LITAIARLKSGWRGGDVAALVASTNAKYAIVLRVKVGGRHGRYLGASLEENKGPELYLYGKSPHWPGLFVTGRLSEMDIQRVKRVIGTTTKRKRDDKTKEIINDFQRRKVRWISHGTILSSEDLMSTLPQPQRIALLSLKEVVDKEVGRITKDIIKIIKDHEYRYGESGELLLTFKLVKDSKEYYVGEDKVYKDLFVRAVTRPRGRLKPKSVGTARCTVCNGPAITGTFEHPPLPFFTLDKANFAPSGNPNLGFKVFPLCSSCYLDIRRGQAYIEDNLDFSIPNPEGGGAPLRFWLIPIINDSSLQEHLQEYLHSMSRGGLYLKNLKELCSKMDLITNLDTKTETFESFLSFSAMFYTFDKQGHMRLISSEQGIYPKRLREIVEVKTQIDNLYPFKREGIRFGFPLIRGFLEDPKTEGWYSRIVTLLIDIFLSKEVNAESIYRVLAEGLREEAKKAELEAIKAKSLRALAVIHFLVRLGLIELSGDGANQNSSQVDDALVDEVRRFIDAHSKLLADGTLRAVCAIGISVGILLEVQRRRPGGSMPFWGRLNRLEVDAEQVRPLFSQVVTKLQQYKENRFDKLISFLGADEVSKLDPTTQHLSRDIISLVFAVGLSEGHMIYNLRERG